MASNGADAHRKEGTVVKWAYKYVNFIEHPCSYKVF